MKITANDLRIKFKELNPNLRQIWLRNKEYIIPTLDELKTVVDKYICELPVIDGFNECENYALFLHSNVKKHIVEEGKLKLNWAFGDFICQKEILFFGTVIHTANICLCDDEFYIVEPLEKNKILKFNDDYRPFFINLM